ncbi:hypothetical protein V6N11_017879 [Hibiscus sabdariffa]|uniref:Uncharacterized protein n=1 Tax=Hibiscus sabdariffa TaxID=183260 RepID=A0ABR2T634_9ROSI
MVPSDLHVVALSFKDDMSASVGVDRVTTLSNSTGDDCQVSDTDIIHGKSKALAESALVAHQWEAKFHRICRESN